MRLLAGTVFDRPPRCERCDQPEEVCRCPPPEPVRRPPQQQTAQLSLENRKRGKVVTLIRGLSLEDSDLPSLLTHLKTLCGAGGSLTTQQLEIQGRHLDRVREELRRMGYQVRG